MTKRSPRSRLPRSQPPPSVAASGPHDIEAEVCRSLLAEPTLSFHNLVIRRTRDGVCLQGIVCGDDQHAADVDSLARRVRGVNEVINQLLVTHDDQVLACGTTDQETPGGS